MKPFVCTIKTAFKYLGAICDETEEKRMDLIKSQQIVTHSTDNYNAWHRYDCQVGQKSGVIHLGMVLNIVQIKEFL